MATTIKDSVYKAIDVIVGKRIEDLHLDKTIEATVDKCLNLKNGKYRLKYGSGIFDAYATGEEVYMPNTAVYVLVPENNFNNKKTIIGRANTGSQTNTEEAQSIASMYNGYSIIGQNILQANDKNKFGLSSHANAALEDGIVLYDANQPNENNLLYVDNERLKIYLEESKGFIFSGKFKTKFSNQQIASTQGEYGLRFNFTLKNGKTAFATMQERWDAQVQKTACIINDETISLDTYKDKVDDIIYNIKTDTTVKDIQQSLNIILINLQNFTAKLDFIDDTTLELVNLYIKLINELVTYTVNAKDQPISIADLQTVYTQWFTGSSYAFEETLYTLDLNTYKMIGNPYYYLTPSYQYAFTEIDPDIFVRIDSVVFYYKNFPYNASLASWGNDIQVEDVSITCIKYLDNVNGDYRLDLEYDDIYFDTEDNDKQTLNVTAKLIYQNTKDITSYSSIMWFKKNSNITSSSVNYSMYAGAGWEHITSNNGKAIFDKAATLTIAAKDNIAYRNVYKVIGMYESSTIVQQEFTLYNNRHKHDIELVSDSGTSFGAGAGKKRITCVIDGNSVVSSDYHFVWYKETANGSRYQIQDSEGLEELQKIIDNVETNLSIKSSTKTELGSIFNIEWETDTNYVIVDSTAVPNNSKIKIICVISSITDNQETELDEVEIILDSGYSVNLKNYYIEIVNGNQAFQYNESGIAPSSDIYEDPIVPQTLSCNFYDPNGGIINPLRYNVSWEVPISNTLIHVDSGSLTYNSINDLNNLLKSDTCPFTINNEYNYNSTNNQIICMVEFDDGDGLVTYRQPTNFFFGKIGDDGTNGTDVVSKITVLENDHQDLKSNYNNYTLLDELLTLKIEPNDKYFWNNGLTMQDPILQLDLFKKNNIVTNTDYKKVNWSILSNGLTSKYWSTQNVSNETTGAKQAILFYNETKNPKNSYTNYIIKAQADLPIDEEKYQTYYNFYPICTDKKYAADPHEYPYNDYDDEGNVTEKTKTVENNYYIGIDRARTLRQVVYNSDGRNPLYDRNLGVGLSFKNLDYPRTIIWEPRGGVITDTKIEEYPSFTLGKSKSYVAAYDSEIDEILNDLEFDKQSEINAKEQEHRDNAISIIKQNIEDNIENWTLEQTELEAQRDTLIETRQNNWVDFKNRRDSSIREAYNNFITLIDNNISLNVWKIEDYLFYNDNRYYYVEGAFFEDIIAFLTQRMNNDDVDNSANVNLDEKTKVLEGLTLVIQDIEDETIKRFVQTNFLTLKNLLLSGYDAYKIIYDRNNQALNNDIVEIKDNLSQVQTQINDYTEVLKTLQPDSGQYIPTNIIYIKEILFEDSLEYAKLNNDLLVSIVLTVKKQFEKDIEYINEKYDTQIEFLTGVITDDSDPTYCSVVPNPVYNGEYPNQYIKISIYQGLVDDVDDNAILEHELIVPFHMSLNTYGLASLNAWDGSSVEINEDEGYVLAPQIGAGVKHTEDNTFTGVLMGTEKTYDDAEGEEEIGLLGYSHGKRSIFLDATTGNATFGLPENDAADTSNPLTEGRIELRPGGTSSISKWNFDARSFYRVATEDESEAVMQARSYTKQYSNSSLGAPYEDAPQYAHGSIPHKRQGILLSALPSYASFKGRILTEEDHTKERVNYLNLNTSVREGDTFELQIDPNDSRFFSLYEHSTRIYEGYGTCDTLNGYQQENKYPLTTEEFNTYFSMFLDNTYDIDEDETIILVQRYLQTNSNGEMKQIFRPLSYLYQNNSGDYYWKMINSTVKRRANNNNYFETTNEYVVGILKQYTDWQNDNKKQTVWKYITFKLADESKPKDILLEATYNSNGDLIGLSLSNDDIINDDTEVWHRYKKAGIDATGKFVAEGIGTGTLGMGLSDIQAFNIGSLFTGASFESNNGTIVQFFVDKLSTDTTSPLFISSTKTLSNPSVESIDDDDEGKRPIRIYAGRDYDDLNTGIFVGKTYQKNPINEITKIELSQTSANDNSIVLSALGSDLEKNKSVLSLVSSSSTIQKGSLEHTGSWVTNIGSALAKTIGGNITFTGNGTSTNQFIFKTNLNIKSNNSVNNITMNSSQLSLVNNTNNQMIISNISSFKAKQQINIIGGQGNTAGTAATNSILLHAQNTSEGLLLAASNATTLSKAVKSGNNYISSVKSGDSYLQLLPSSTPTNARFFLFAGTHSYIYSGVGLKGGNGVILGPNLKVGNGNGQIEGNGTNISHTAAGNSSGPTAAVTVSGWSGTGTIKVPRVTMSTNGRPTFSEYNLTITMPSKPTDYSQAIKDLQTAVSNLQTTVTGLEKLKSHTHKLSGSSSYVITQVYVKKDGKNVTDVTVDRRTLDSINTLGPQVSTRNNRR